MDSNDFEHVFPGHEHSSKWPTRSQRNYDPFVEESDVDRFNELKLVTEKCMMTVGSNYMDFFNHTKLTVVLPANRLVMLQWRHNERGGVSDHQSHGCLLKRLFRLRSKKTSKLRLTGLCAGNSPVTGEYPVTGEFPAQKASNAGNVSIWWRHHDKHMSSITVASHEGS